jgi:hypothetical protein
MTRIRMSILAVGAGISLAAMAAPAASASSGTSGRSPALTLTVAKGTIPLLKSKSTAGYLSELRGIKSVTATFEVPRITSCTAHQNAGMGPVIILVGNGYFVGAGAEAECQDGTVSYMIAINHNGAETHPLNVAAKNKITVSIGIGAKVVVVKIDDLTTKAKTSQSLPKGKVTAAELGDDSLTQGRSQVPIPKFSNHEFSDVKINGKVLTHAGPLLDEELVRGKTVLIKPGPINKAGDAFAMDFEHAT